MPKLSIIIPACNETLLNHTIASIRATTRESDVEIVVIDDASDVPVKLEDKNVLLLRNKARLGPGHSRHIGAEHATSEHILLLDSHMTFESGWLEKAVARITLPNRENVVHCGSCVGLDATDLHLEEYNRHTPWSEVQIGRRRVVIDGQLCAKVSESEYTPLIGGKPAGIFQIRSQDELVLLQATHRYLGAKLNLYGKNGNSGEFQVFEGIWADDPPGNLDDYELSCLMGACYFFNKKWFFHIGGLKANRQWGCEEPYLALKTYLAGGSIRMMKGVRIGHKFHHNSTPYRVELHWKNYNKARSIMTTCNAEEARFLISKLKSEREWARTEMQLRLDKAEIEVEHDYNQKIFCRDLSWFCRRFNIKHPLTVEELPKAA